MKLYCLLETEFSDNLYMIFPEFFMLHFPARMWVRLSQKKGAYFRVFERVLLTKTTLSLTRMDFNSRPFLFFRLSKESLQIRFVSQGFLTK